MKKRTSSAFSDAINLLNIAKYLEKKTYFKDISKIKETILKLPNERSESDIQILYEFIYIFNYVQKLKSKYSEQFVKEICRYIYYKQVNQNTVIHTHKTVFLVLSGRVQINIQQENGEKSINQELTFGTSFNDYGLNETKRCYAKAIRPTELACLDFKIFNEISSNKRSSEIYEKQNLIKQISFLQQFSDVEIKYLSYHFEQTIISKNSIIYEEGIKDIDFFYFISIGEVEISKLDSNGNLIHLTRLINGEYFGEESFLQLNNRIYSAKCVQDDTLIYRVNALELDKRLWRKEQRKVFADLLSQKWTFRYLRFCDITQTKPNTKKLKQELQALYVKMNLNNTPILEIKEEKRQKTENDEVQELQISCSWLMKSAKSAQNLLNIMHPQRENNLDIMKITTSPTRLKIQLNKIEQEHKQSHLQNRKLKINSNHRFKSVHTGKVSSNIVYLQQNNGLNTDRVSTKPLEEQLNEYLDKVHLKEDQINWEDNGTYRDKEDRINKFYKTMSTYANQQYYKNKNLQESKSQKAKQLEKDYCQLIQQQEANLKKAFLQDTKVKSDNVIRKEFFLSQLKKMQKRLKTLEKIQKGQLQIKVTQFVNDDGEIVDIEEDCLSDDVYDVINGKKVRKFNFVSTEIYAQMDKHRFRDLDSQITQQKQKINLMHGIVIGKLPTSAAKEINIEIQNNQNLLKPPQNHINHFITEQRRQSSFFKNDILKTQFQKAQ